MSESGLINRNESKVDLMVSQNAIHSILKSQIVMSNDAQCLRSQSVTLKHSENLRFRNGTSNGYEDIKTQSNCTSLRRVCTSFVQVECGAHKKAIELCIGAEGMLTKLEGI